MSKRDFFKFAGEKIAPGTEVTVPVELPRLYDRSEVSMPVRVLHGSRPGPCLLISSAIHGDEVNGLEIVYRLLQRPLLPDLAGTLIAVPFINAYGLVTTSRYLPDRRDLNRLFPGSTTGSLTARLARLLLDTLLVHATHMIDLHTGGLHRSNFPQIRATLQLPATRKLARAFRPPVILDAPARAGSFRQTADKRGIPSIVYETGEALRFDDVGIQVGVAGILSTMAYLEMLPPQTETDGQRSSVFARQSRWLRAPASGVFRSQCRLGDMVGRRARLGSVSDPLGDAVFKVSARHSGIVIGRNNMPLVYQGDPLLHIAEVSDLAEAETAIERISSPPPMSETDNEKIVVGWREWVALPSLGVERIKAKVDTGARTSAIHAHEVRAFRRGGKRMLRFKLSPVQHVREPEVACEAEIIDERPVTDSGGHREKRFVILTDVVVADQRFPIEVTITRRDSMRFRMLLGRTAMAGRILVDPQKSFLSGK